MIDYVSAFCSNRDALAYRLLFEVESYLRTLVRWELRGAYPADWKGRLPARFVAAAKERCDQERTIGYLDERRSGLLSYLNLSELKDVITDALWGAALTDAWPPKELLRGEFKKLIGIRNKVAHFRPVTARDLRVISRFVEDLEDWTKHYKRARLYAPFIESDSGAGQDENVFRGFSPIQQLWTNCENDGVAMSYRLCVTRFEHHFMLRGRVCAGSLNPARFVDWMERNDKVISFCRLDAFAERSACYISNKIESSKIIRVFEEFLALLREATEGLSSDDVRNEFPFAEREGLLPWHVELPANFVPTGPKD